MTYGRREASIIKIGKAYGHPGFVTFLRWEPVHFFFKKKKAFFEKKNIKIGMVVF
jgi:hypothetical protein